MFIILPRSPSFPTNQQDYMGYKLLNKQHGHDWLKQFPQLERIDDSAWQEALSQSNTVTFPAGVTLYRSGDTCENFVLVIDGSIRVQMVSDSGSEVVLYRVEEGQSCILSTTCLLSHERYHAEGITETEVHAVAIPVKAFHNALAKSEGFRQFVFSSYARRITDLFMLIDAITFGRMDSRLAATLLARSSATQPDITITHYDLARELGTAREVVSRLLKDFERRQWLSLARGSVTIQDRSKLENLASKNGQM